jgi:hypothetical protein
MKKIIIALMVLLFSLGVVGTAVATGDYEATSCYKWTYDPGKYVASSDGYHDDGYKDGSSSSYDDGYHDGSSSYDDSEHDSEHDKSSSY